tara:strand:+ start:230 stop:604 length:375 start_codon:yes stop_codon:yes gene_type:complete
MRIKKDRLYIMTYVETQWIDHIRYIRTYERIELEDYIKMVLKQNNKEYVYYTREEVIDEIESLGSGWCINQGASDEDENPSILIKTNSKINANKAIRKMERENEEEEERIEMSYLEMGYYNDWD